MLTRSQAKLQQQARIEKPKQTPVSKPVNVKPKQVTEKKTSVRLTEDLLYIVNKKLTAMDKETRDDKIQNFGHESRPWMKPIPGPFTEIAYRKQNSSDLWQIELAVMHKINYDSNSTAICKLNSMDEFFRKMNRAAAFAKSADYKRFLDYEQGTAVVRVKNPVARFFQLPKDYYRPHSDCLFFGELAWKENGVMTVEANKFALCLTVWTMKEWLANPIDNSYPLKCRLNGGLCCCQNLLHAMCTDDRLRPFVEDKTIFNVIDYDSVDDEDEPVSLRDSYMELQSVHRETKNYARKLFTGEEMISRSIRSINVLAASQLQRIREKLEIILKCFEHDLMYRDVYSD